MAVYFIYSDEEVTRLGDFEEAVIELMQLENKPMAIIEVLNLRVKMVYCKPDEVLPFYVHIFESPSMSLEVCFDTRAKAAAWIDEKIKWEDGEPCLSGYEKTIVFDGAGNDPDIENWFNRDELKQQAADEAEDLRARNATWRE